MTGFDANDVLREHGEDELRRRFDFNAGHRSLDHVHAVFRKWLGPEYDMDTLNAVLAAAAAQRLPGDPVWLLYISGSGNGKTETLGSLGDITNCYITSTISSEGALL